MEKILIIDNSPLDQRILRDILKDRYEILTSLNGNDGLEKTKEFSPSLVLLDMQMPNMDSFAILLRLKELNKINSAPIIITTSAGSIEVEEKGLLLGAVDCFTKPFLPGIVRARVKTHIELYALRKKIEELALIDSLTRIPNRRSYDERIDFEWGHAMRDSSPLSIVMLDVDRFKEYNDHYGHSKGDEVLRLIAAEMEHALTRRTDFVARYGGEEFVFILPNTPKDGGLLVAEKVRGSIEGLRIPHVASTASDVVTVSLGGATFIPDDDCSAEELFDLADRMLYKAKDSGRNLTIWG